MAFLLNRKKPPSKPSISEDLLSTLRNWKPGHDGVDELLQLSEKSLTEVKHLTEYEDDKANRILTAIAFLSALAGVLYIGLLPKDNQIALTQVLYHGVFGFYCVLTVAGAFLVITAVRPKFNIPKGWGDPGENDLAGVKRQHSPPSFLFFEKVLAVRPEDWAKAFQGPLQDLKLTYIKNYVHESYLVADKIRQKLRYLQPGVRCLQFGVLMLGFWMFICAWSVYGQFSQTLITPNPTASSVNEPHPLPVDGGGPPKVAIPSQGAQQSPDSSSSKRKTTNGVDGH